VVLKINTVGVLRFPGALEDLFLGRNLDRLMFMGLNVGHSRYRP
jgi:hypothetical protein